MRLNDRTLAALPRPESGQKLYADDTLPGFGVRVGVKTTTFVLTVGAERKRMTLGRYPLVTLSHARGKARTILAKRQLGLDEPQSPPLKVLIEEYLNSRGRKIRRSTANKDAYVSNLFRAMESTQLSALKPERVQAFIDGFESPWTRHYCLGFFAGLVRYAQKQGYSESWPLHRLEAPIEPKTRERVLTLDELRSVITTARIWAAAGSQFGSIVDILVRTGQRRQQIGSLHRSYVDYDEHLIHWPAGLMKKNKAHTVPMSPQVETLLDRRINGLYFPNQFGNPFSAWSVQFKKFRTDCGVDFWLHDLRRTLATGWQQLGVRIEVTERMLSHSSLTGGLVGIYQRHSYIAEMREAVTQWEDYLAQLC